MLKLITFLYLVQITYCEEFCYGREIVRDVNTSRVFSINDELCESAPCIIRQCSRPNTMLMIDKKNKARCESIDNVKNITNINFDLTKLYPVYKTDYLENNKKSEINLWDIRHVVYNNSNLWKSACSDAWRFDSESESFKILEDGSLLCEISNHNQRFITIPKMSFIVDFVIKQNRNGEWMQPVMKRKQLTQPLKKSSNPMIYNGAGMVISCFFFVLVLIIYGLLRYLRNLAGMVLMAHMVSLTVGFGLRAVQTFVMFAGKMSTKGCQWTSPLMYFALLASFFWMNVMAFDTWWTFRASYKVRIINRRGTTHKFCMYSLYAFGMPLLITIMAQVIELMDVTNYPHIRRPEFNSCMNTDNIMQYLYIPIMILLCGNLIFFLMTSFNIWRIKRDLDRHCSTIESTNNKKTRNRFIIYIKLSVLSGINWTLECLNNFLDLPSWLAYIINTNALIGLGVFVLFVCNRKIFLRLCKRFSINNRVVERIAKSESRKSDSHKTSTQS